MPVGEAGGGPGAGVGGGCLSDGVDELVVPADELFAVLPARDAAPARRERPRWGERAEAVQTLPFAEGRSRARVPLPGPGEGGGGGVVGADAGEGVAEAGQPGGEGVGLLGCEGVRFRRWGGVRKKVAWTSPSRSSRP